MRIVKGGYARPAKANAKATLHYIFDPLCGWCYGAAPLVEVARKIDGLQLVWHGGGMWAGSERQVVSRRWGEQQMSHDWRIAEFTDQHFGQPYFEGLLRDSGALLDSEPPITAMLVVQALSGRGLDMLDEMQRAYYVQGRRISDYSVLRELALGLGLESGTFDHTYGLLRGERTQRHMADSRQWLQRLEGLGFPAFALERGGGEAELIDVSRWMGQPWAWRVHLKQQLREAGLDQVGLERPTALAA